MKNLNIRKLINLISLSIILIAFYFLIIKNSFFLFLGHLLFSAILYLPRVIYKNLNLRKIFGPRLLDWIEIFFSFSMILAVAGYLWLFDKLYNYDSYVHFFTPLLFFLVIALITSAILQYYKIENTKSDLILLSLVIVMSLLLFWELFEYFVTVKLNYDMFFEKRQPNDTLYDIVVGFLSLPVGSVIIYKYHDLFFDSMKKDKHKII